MDKNTLSHYGWIVIAIIIISILLGLAVPFAVSIRDKANDVANGLLTPDSTKAPVSGNISITARVPVDIGDSHASSFDYEIGVGDFDTVKIYKNGELQKTYVNTITSGDNNYGFTEGDFIYGDKITVELYKDGNLVGVDNDIYDYLATTIYNVTLSSGDGISNAKLEGYLSITNNVYLYTSNSQATVIAELERGYEFDGWYDQNGSLLSTNPVYSFTVVRNVDLVAKAVLAEYNINYETRGGTLSSGVTQKYTVKDTVVLPTPTRLDFIFDGWYESENLTGDVVTAIKDSVGDKTYYAKWLPNILNITAKGYSGVYDGNPHSITVTCEGATISYSEDGINYQSQNFEYTNATNEGPRVVYYKVEKAGHTTITSQETVNIDKAPGSVVLSNEGGILTYPAAGTFSVVTNKSGGALTIKTSKPDVATLSLNGNKVTMTPKVAGTTIITVTSAETTNYTSASASYALTVKVNALDVFAEGYTGEYDEQYHSITVTCPGASITYATEKGGYYSSENPQYLYPGVYVVYYRVEKAGYPTVDGDETVAIDKLTPTLELNPSSGFFSFSQLQDVEIISNVDPDDEFALSYTAASKNPDIAYPRFFDDCLSVIARDVEGTTEIVVTSVENEIYKSATATYRVTVTENAIPNIFSEGYIGVYDGMYHGIAVECENAETITFSTSPDGPFTSAPISYRDVGEYVVYYKVTQSGFDDAYGYETIIITQANGKILLDQTSAVFFNPGEKQTATITQNASGGKISIINSNENVASAVIDGDRLIVTAGTTTGGTIITLYSPATQNHTSATATFIVTNVSIQGYVGVYDGQPHNGTVICNGRRVYYKADGSGNATTDICPSRIDAGNYSIKFFIYDDDGYPYVESSVPIVINKASFTITISPDKGTMPVSSSAFAFVTTSVPDIPLGVVSSNPSVVDGSLSNGILNIYSRSTPGEEAIVVYANSTQNYNSTSAAYVATVVDSTSEAEGVTAIGYAGVYDGLPHNITVECDGATITYAESEYGPYTPINPQYTNAGTYTVYYNVSRPGFSTVAGSKQVVISKAPGHVVLSDDIGSLTYPGSESIRVTENKSGGTLSVSSDAPESATALIDGFDVTITAQPVSGDAIITVTSAETQNYFSASATYTVTVTAPDGLDIVATGYSGIYDGNPHSITVTCDGATITYSETEFGTYTTANPQYVNAGSYTVYYKVNKPGVPVVGGNKQVKIEKAEGKVVLSDTSGSMTYPDIQTIEVVENLSHGTLSVSTNNSASATASIKDNTVTIASQPTPGTAIITVTSAETTNYKEASATYTVKLNNPLEVESCGYEGVYDGQPHSITVICGGATIMYATEENGTYSTVNPQFTNAGNYTVYYKVTKDGAGTVTGCEPVTIKKANGSVVLSAISGTTSCSSSKTVEVIVNKSGGALSVSSNNPDCATATIEDNTVTVTAHFFVGSTVITVTSAETTNYNSASTTYTINVINESLDIEAYGYEGVYDKQPHGITVICDEATITYATEKNGTYSTVNPQFTNAGTYIVYYKVAKAGATTVTGNQKVFIDKAPGRVTLSATSGSTTYPNIETIEVTHNESGGNLSVSTSNPSVATVSINNKTVTIASQSVSGSATLVVTSAETDNYYSASAEYTIVVSSGALDVTAVGYSGVYDEKPHSITVICDGATITYFDNASLSYTSQKPSYTDAGTYTVRYKVEKDGYNTITGSEKVFIDKAPGKVELSTTQDSITYPGTATVLIKQHTGSLSVSGNNPASASASIDGTTMTVKSNTTPGTAVFTIIAAESANYYSASATYTVTVAKLSRPVALILDNTDNASDAYPMVFTIGSQEVGDTYNGLTILHAYTGFTTASYIRTTVPWYNEREMVTSVSVDTVIAPKSVAAWFNEFKNCSTFDVANLDVSRVESFDYTFAFVGYSTASLDLSSISTWNTESATHMNCMFYSAGYNANFIDNPIYDFSVDLSGWNVSNVTSVDSMFASAGLYASSVDIDVSWGSKTSNFQSIQAMFNWLNRYQLSGDHTDADYGQPDPIRTTIEIRGLENWDTSNITDMSYFINSVGWHCDNFEIDLSGWDVSSVTNFDYAFDSFGFRAGYASLGDLSAWEINTKDPVRMNCMFRYTGKRADNFLLLNLNNWDTTTVIEATHFCHEANWFKERVIPPNGIGSCSSSADCDCET